jgi:hypothetical protein
VGLSQVHQSSLASARLVKTFVTICNSRKGAEFVNPAPSKIDGATVLYYAIIDYHQLKSGGLQGRVKALAICQYDDTAFYLLGCDEHWKSVTDTWHETLADVQAQAEFEYSGISRCWQEANPA